MYTDFVKWSALGAAVKNSIKTAPRETYTLKSYTLLSLGSKVGE